jgi:hypothetical protein
MIISITGSTTAISSPSALVVRSTTTRMTLAGLGSQHALVGSGFMFAATTTENPRSAKWLSSSIDEPGKPTSMSGRVKWPRTRTVTSWWRVRGHTKLFDSTLCKIVFRDARRLALSLRALSALGEGQKSESPCDHARGEEDSSVKWLADKRQDFFQRT